MKNKKIDIQKVICYDDENTIGTVENVSITTSLDELEEIRKRYQKPGKHIIFIYKENGNTTESN